MVPYGDSVVLEALEIVMGVFDYRFGHFGGGCQFCLYVYALFILEQVNFDFARLNKTSSLFDRIGAHRLEHLQLETGISAVKTQRASPGRTDSSFGTWDRQYGLDDKGSRGIVLLDEEKGRLMVVYTSYRDNSIVYRTSNTSLISFGSRHTLIQGTDNINNATCTKQNVNGDAVIVAEESGIAFSVRATW